MITINGEDGASATFNDTMTHRYLLTRTVIRQAKGFSVGGSRCVFLMLNPSTADAFKLDPTVTRCRNFCERWGFNTLHVVNLFALRSPNPGDLVRGARIHGYKPELRPDAIDPLNEQGANDQAIQVAVLGADLVVCAWGNHGSLADRDVAVRRLIAPKLKMVRMVHLGLTLMGQPKHPLARGARRIPDDFEPIDWKEISC